MKNILFFAVATFVALALTNCSEHSHAHQEHTHDSHTHTTDNGSLQELTLYSDAHELFVQLHPLIAGNESHVTTYITRLSDFKPIAETPVMVALVVGADTVRHTINPLHRGIYEFKIAPKKSGKGVLQYVFKHDAEEAVLSLPVSVAEACHHHEHEGHHHHEHVHSPANEEHHAHAPVNAFSFLKEQSWKIDFATDVASKSKFNGTIKVAAQVTTMPDNLTTLVAATAGRVRYIDNPVAGKCVQAGEALFLLDGGDVTENDAAVKFSEAESRYNVAKADYERKKALNADNIVSQKELENAQAALHSAEAYYNSMKRNYNSGNILLKSPMAGYISEIKVANGDYVAPGTAIAAVQCDGAFNINAELPVRYASALSDIATVNIELQDGEVFALDEMNGRVTAVGRSVNGCAMIPLTLTVNKTPKIISGSIVTLYILSEMPNGKECISLPRTALVEEMGNFFVFVQHTPVSFEKREVKIGSTDGRYTQIVEGINEGERVVTKGALSLKLSQGAATLDPHAGHVH